MVHITEDLFVMVMADYTVIFTRECLECFSQIAYPGQGHRCPCVEAHTQQELDEAEAWAKVLEGSKALYRVPAQ